MRKDESIAIDADLCSGCGACVAVCPHEVLTVRDGAALFTGERCMECGHCEAACPTGAVRCLALDPEAGRFETFATDEDWLPFGAADVGEIVRLMRSRRSCRNFTEQPVDAALLRDLAKVGATAPSGTNSQRWVFGVLPDRAAVLRAGETVGAFFRRLNALVEKRWLVQALRVIGRSTLADYRRRHYASVCDALRRFEHDGEDLLFHGATAVIGVGSRPGASCPAEDALLAAQNILLAAHAMGLGTCLVGYVVEAARRDARVLAAMGLEQSESLHAVIALGWPDERFERVAGRRTPPIRFVGGDA